MNQKKTKNRNTLLFFLVFNLLYCNITSKKKLDYFSGNFTCTNSPEEQEDNKSYREYLLQWSQLKKIYTLQNTQINRSKVVMVGDSLIHFFPPEILKNEFPTLDIQNRGIGGDTTYLLKERIYDNVINLKPEIILLQIGGNDLIQGKCLSFIEKNYTEIIKEIRDSLPNSKILILSVPPTGVRELNSIVPVFNLFLIQFSKIDKNIDFIDVWREMRDVDRPIIKMDYRRDNDKIHFNERGYIAWAKLLKPYLK
jgi:lysophospholipase L1-like esterase